MPEMNAICQIRGNLRLFRQKSPIGTGQDSFFFFFTLVGLCCYTQAFPSCAKQEDLDEVCWLLLAVASL